MIKSHLTTLLATFAITLGACHPLSGQTCVPLPSGAVSWWPAEGTGKDVVGTNDGTFTGAAAFATGEVGQGWNFAGTSDFVQVADSPSLSFTNDFSIELWYEDTGMSPGAYGGLIAKRPATPANAPCNFGVTIIAPSTLLIYLLDSNSGSYQSLSYSGLPAAGAFHHLAISFHQLPAEQIQLKAYVDGQPVASSTVPGSLARTVNHAPVTIGASNSNGEFFKGIIDEAAIYSRLLSDSEIAAIYAAGKSGKCLNVAPVILDQPTNATVFQGSTVTMAARVTGAQPMTFQWVKDGAPVNGATNTALTLTNVQVSQSGTYVVQITNSFGSATSSNAVLTVKVPPACTTPPAGLVSWWRAEGDTADNVGTNTGAIVGGVSFAPAEVGQGFTFDGNHSYVQIADSPSLTFTSDFSIELWYKDTGLVAGQYGALIGKRPFSGPCNYGLTIIGGGPSSPGTLLVYFLDPKYGSYQSLSYPGVPIPGAFHHLAATFHQAPSEQIQLKAYIDGQLVQTTSLPGSLSRTVDTAPVCIGCSNPNGEFFKGLIDEVSIYGGLLSDTDIQSIYLSGAGGKCSVPLPAHIFQQPSDQVAVVGQTATFRVGGAGTYPLSYQWSYNGSSITGAVNSTLVLTNVQVSQAGTYSVVVTNGYGSAASSNATLVVNFPPAGVNVVSTSGTAGQLITVPVVLVANGNENAVGFSLNYSPTQLTNVGVTLGKGATGGSLQFNSGGPGTVGVAVSLPSGATFAPGTQEVAEVSFIAAVSSTAYSSALSFGDLPTKRQLSDAKANALAVNFTGGQVNVARSFFEADVAPRPDGDGSVSVTDWVQVGRYAAALDSPTNSSEFQRADCAPRSSLGDGLLTVSDWVQAGRYVAGLDPLTVAGGPTVPAGGQFVGPLHKDGSSPGRAVTVTGTLVFHGQTATATVDLEALGDENGVGFSLSFDPAALSYTGVLLGSDSTSANIDVNANGAANGEIGVILALPTGNSYPAGTRELVKVSFQAVATNSIDAPLVLTDVPVHREVADTNAVPVASAYANAVISVNPRPSLSITHTNSTVNLSWPLWGTNYLLQQAGALTLPVGTWTNVSATRVVSSNSFGVSLPMSGSVQFYRLQHQ